MEPGQAGVSRTPYCDYDLPSSRELAIMGMARPMWELGRLVPETFFNLVLIDFLQKNSYWEYMWNLHYSK